MKSLNEILEFVRAQGCTVSLSGRQSQPAHDIVYGDQLILRTGTESKGGFVEVPISRFKKNKAYKKLQDEREFKQMFNKFPPYRGKPARGAQRPAYRLYDLNATEVEELVSTVVAIGKSLSEGRPATELFKNLEVSASRENNSNSSNQERSAEELQRGVNENVLPEISETSNVEVVIYPDEETDTNESLSEGGTIKVFVNRYERNSKARAKCIEFYGFECQVCSINFEKKYGAIGKNYIHVHHLAPISTYTERYELDPVKDLVPVCPNCHAMLHKNDPPYSVQALKAMIK